MSSGKAETVEKSGFKIIKIRRKMACSDKTARDVCVELRQS